MSTKSIWTTIIIGLVVIIGLWYFLDNRNLQLTPTDASSTKAATTTSSTSAASTGNSSSDQKTNSTSMKNFSHTVTIETTKGTIVFETYDADAPKTVENFLTLINKSFYDGTIFHRVINGFMIQGGDPTGTGRGGPGYQFADELDSATPSYKIGYVRGTVAMANAGPNTNGSQFFIMQADQALPHNYTIFGKVVKGMDVVDAIATSKTDQSDRPVVEIKMTKVTSQAK